MEWNLEAKNHWQADTESHCFWGDWIWDYFTIEHIRKSVSFILKMMLWRKWQILDDIVTQPLWIFKQQRIKKLYNLRLARKSFLFDRKWKGYIQVNHKFSQCTAEKMKHFTNNLLEMFTGSSEYSSFCKNKINKKANSLFASIRLYARTVIWRVEEMRNVSRCYNLFKALLANVLRFVFVFFFPSCVLWEYNLRFCSTCRVCEESDLKF